MVQSPDLHGLHKDGSEFAAEIVLSPIEMDDEVLVCAGIRDVSHRRQMEQALRTSEERFDLAVRGTDAGIWDWDLSTNHVYYSPRWKGMLGFAEDELANDFSTWKSRVHPDDLERSLETLQAYLDGQDDHYELEHRLRHRDGGYRWILARGALVRDAHGQPCRMVGSHLDITDRKQAERQLREREAQLIAAQRIQEHFLPCHSPDLPGYDIAGRVIPAQFAGGDYYDYLQLADGTLAIVVGDVSGHDVSAALVTASTSAHLRSFAEDYADVAVILERTNSLLSRGMEDGRFVTLVAVQLDPATTTIRYVNAGHPSGYVLDAAGNVKTKLKSTSFPLSVLANTEYALSSPLQLAQGDLVLLTTDGVLEAQSPADEGFDEERLLCAVRSHQQQSSREIIDAVAREVLSFVGRSQLQDDVTLVIMKIE